jgi:hypothetical protein
MSCSVPGHFVVITLWWIMPDIALPFPSVPLSSPKASPADIRALQARLLARGCGPVGASGSFDDATVLGVKRFQVRFSDLTGRPLVVDGIVGPVTWDALFGRGPTVAVSAIAPSLATDALEFALAEVGVLEAPPHSNRGPRVDQYARAVGLDPADGLPWCVAFAYWCFAQAAARAQKTNPLPKTAGVLKHWHTASKLAGVQIVKGTDAVENPALVQPGFLFAMDFGGGVGHLGFIAEVAGGHLVTIEGNTGPDGTREGIGVFRRTARRLSNINLGFVDYTAF